MLRVEVSPTRGCSSVMLDLLVQATALFALTNIDTMIVLAAIFGIGGPRAPVFIGQYVGFVAILAVAFASSLGAGLLPPSAFRCLGLIPLAMGLRLAWLEWARALASDRRGDGASRPTAWSVAAIALANGGDNIGAYAPLFAGIGVPRSLICCAVFLVLVAVWCLLGLALVRHPFVARALTRGGRMVLPFVLIFIGALVLFTGGAFANTPL